MDSDLDALRFAGYYTVGCGCGAEVVLVCADVRDLTPTWPCGGGPAAVFIDPARRAGGRRLQGGESEPALGWCLDRARQVPKVCIKAAPGLPRHLVPAGWECEFVATGRALKEGLLWAPAFATTPRQATVRPAGATLVASCQPR